MRTGVRGIRIPQIGNSPTRLMCKNRTLNKEPLLANAKGEREDIYIGSLCIGWWQQIIVFIKDHAIEQRGFQIASFKDSNLVQLKIYKHYRFSTLMSHQRQIFLVFSWRDHHSTSIVLISTHHLNILAYSHQNYNLPRFSYSDFRIIPRIVSVRSHRRQLLDHMTNNFFFNSGVQYCRSACWWHLWHLQEGLLRHQAMLMR